MVGCGLQVLARMWNLAGAECARVICQRSDTEDALRAEVAALQVTMELSVCMFQCGFTTVITFFHTGYTVVVRSYIVALVDN